MPNRRFGVLALTKYRGTAVQAVSRSWFVPENLCVFGRLDNRSISGMENILHTLYTATDLFLISFYRLTGIPILDFMIGTFNLSMLCVVTGELSVSLALKINKRYVDEMTREMTEKERLSMAALRSGDKEGYKALNKEATNAWGKRFFTMVAYSAGILWPLPFAMGWLGSRFADVDFLVAPPLSLAFENGVGYAFIFIPMYILTRILFKYMRPYLPYFKGVQKMLDAGVNPAASNGATRKDS